MELARLNVPKKDDNVMADFLESYVFVILTSTFFKLCFVWFKGLLTPLITQRKNQMGVYNSRFYDLYSLPTFPSKHTNHVKTAIVLTDDEG